MKTVAIIGGGFSGTMAAVNMARLSSQPVQIKIVNDRHPLGRGVAYGTRREEHLLNVAARNMSAVPDHSSHFLDWLRTRVEYSDLPETQLRETFAPRRVYGDYVRGVLMNYLKPIDNRLSAKIDVVQDEAIDVIPDEDGSASVMLRDGEPIAADRILLATGNQAPTPLATFAGVLDHPAYCNDPWADWQSKVPDLTGDVIVIGTGLTMVDVFLTLSELGWQGKMVAISRNAMLPQAHFRGIEYPDFLPDEPEGLGLKRLVALLEDHCRRLQQSGEHPGIVVDRLRPHTQRIWQRFSHQEKEEFLKNYATRWNVIRHRIAQPLHQRITEAIAEERVRIVKGSIQSVQSQDDQLAVTVQGQEQQPRTFTGGLVINCTGPNAGFSGTDIPLYRNLLERGLIRSDEMDMGIDVGSDFAVLDAAGNCSSFLYALGPLMKGTLWETTAVPELRGQAMRVAQILVDEVTTPTADVDYRFSVEGEHVIEYYI